MSSLSKGTELRIKRNRTTKLKRSIEAFNKNDSVSFQANRSIKGVAHDLFLKSIAREIDRLYESPREHPARLLEVGCGSGPWIESTLNYIVGLPASPSIEITGIDPADRLIESAKQRFKEYPSVVVHNHAFQTYTAPKKFDLVYFVDVIQHFERQDYNSLFSKLNDLLEPGGVTVIIDKERYSYYSLKMMIKRKVRELPEYYYTAEYPSFRRLTRLGSESGFDLERKFRQVQFCCLIMSKRA